MEAGGDGWRWRLARGLALRAGNRARAGDGGGRGLLCQGWAARDLVVNMDFFIYWTLSEKQRKRRQVLIYVFH